MKIDLKYRIPLVGRYNGNVYQCPTCKENLLSTLFNNIIGFAETLTGEFAVVECPKCFTKWHYHSRIEEGNGSHYYYFLDAIKNKQQKHFKS